MRRKRRPKRRIRGLPNSSIAPRSRGAVPNWRAQTRSNPELLLATTRERDGFGDSARADRDHRVHPLRLGESQPLRTYWRAEALEAEEQLRFERERLLADLEAADARVQAARKQFAAAEKRARLAGESRGFFEKSFRMGETDLPTRLRIELEAVEAENRRAVPASIWLPQSLRCARHFDCSQNRNDRNHENHEFH